MENIILFEFLTYCTMDAEEKLLQNADKNTAYEFLKQQIR